MNELRQAKLLLNEDGCTCVLCRGDEILTSSERGIKPLIKWLDSGIDLSGSYAADKIVGKAAAMLYVLLKVKAVYAPVMSKNAVRLLSRHEIAAEYDEAVEMIINRAGTGLCPMEEAVKDIKSPREGCRALRRRLAQMPDNSTPNR